MRFEWDRRKDRTNRQKHGLSFAEAAQLFESAADYLEIFDGDHSDEEERFVAIGPIRRGLIVVVWTERIDEAIRLVSARFATRQEKTLFRKYMAGGR